MRGLRVAVPLWRLGGSSCSTSSVASRLWLSASSRLLLLLLLTRGLAGVAHAGTLDLISWSPDEELAGPVTELSTGATPAAVWTNWNWLVVYASEGEIWLRTYNGLAWAVPFQLSHGAGPARDPHITDTGGAVVVVWEDERSGHPEIWSVVGGSGSWGAETALTADATASRHPAIAASSGVAYLVWEEGDDGSRTVCGRRWSGGQWGAVEVATAGPAEEFEPAITMDSYHGVFRLVWTDSRHGPTEIYGRTRGTSGTPSWGAETRLTNLPGACRRSSPQANDCCGDVMTGDGTLLFENDQYGVPEVFAACNWGEYGMDIVPLSANDGIGSSAPCASGFGYFHGGCMMGGNNPIYLDVWSDQLPSGSIGQNMAGHGPCLGAPQMALVSSQGTGGILVASAGGNPQAQLLLMRIEDRDGTPTLIARRGTQSGCWDPSVHPPAFALVSPGGVQATTVRSIDSCSGDPVSGEDLFLDFRHCPGLTWSADQQHPMTPSIYTNEDGEAAFHIHAGGCLPAGEVVAWCGGFIPTSFYGVRSTDVDGDCIVTSLDLQYVQARLGTGDFCADLDGSGVVDTADVGMVRRTQGEHCQQITDVDLAEPTGAERPAGGLSIAVRPNPCRGAAQFTIRRAETVFDQDAAGGSRDTGELVVVDVQGRVVRRFAPPLSTEPLRVVWDTRDAGGRPVPSGLYGVVLRDGERSVRRGVLVVR